MLHKSDDAGYDKIYGITKLVENCKILGHKEQLFGRNWIIHFISSIRVHSWHQYFNEITLLLILYILIEYLLAAIQDIFPPQVNKIKSEYLINTAIVPWNINSPSCVFGACDILYLTADPCLFQFCILFHFQNVLMPKYSAAILLLQGIGGNFK